MSAPRAGRGAPAVRDDQAVRDDPAAPGYCTADVCITCSDTAVPVRVLSLHGYELATVRTEAGTDEEISVALVDAGVGDIVLVHAGEAIARIDTGPARPGTGHPPPAPASGPP